LVEVLLLWKISTEFKTLIFHRRPWIHATEFAEPVKTATAKSSTTEANATKAAAAETIAAEFAATYVAGLRIVTASITIGRPPVPVCIGKDCSRGGAQDKHIQAPWCIAGCNDIVGVDLPDIGHLINGPARWDRVSVLAVGCHCTEADPNGQLTGRHKSVINTSGLQTLD
jgi:hypothetical protein